MKKTLIALAALGMVAGAAQATNVTVYGKLQPSIDLVDTGSVDVQDMTWNNSRLGFKGSEDLGNGLKAVFQIESKVKFTEDTVDGFGGRDSWVGLKGDFGSVTVGKHQSAYVKSSAKYDVFSDSIGDYNNIMGSVAATDGEFNGRYAKSVYYKSPSFNGFKVQASYALVAQNADNTQDVDVLSLAGNYSNGPLMAVAAYEHKAASNDGLDMTSNDAWKIGVGYKAPFGTKFMAIYEDVDNGSTNGDHDNFYLAAKHPVNGNLDVAASFIMADDTDANNDGAKAWNIGATYKFSKRTSVLGLYSKVSNDAGASYGFDSGYAASAAGQDVSGFSVRLQHKF